MVVGGVARFGACVRVWKVLFFVVLFCAEINVIDSSEGAIERLLLRDTLGSSRCLSSWYWRVDACNLYKYGKIPLYTVGLNCMANK
jgi:hypothetical protein